MSSAETTESADTASRVCAWADCLAGSGRVDDARQVLRASLDRSGDSVAVALRLAELEAQAGASARAAELLKQILGDRPGHLPASRLLAGLLLAEGRADEAARVVSGAAGQLAEYGELAGQIWRVQGRHAAAVRAFDACPSLSAQGRRSRRRSWWLSGGPFGRRSRDVPLPGAVPESSAPVPSAEPSDDLLEVLSWAKRLRSQDRSDEARQVVADALDVHGRHPRLLRCAAEIEDAAKAPNTALYLWRKAYEEAPEDVDITCGLALQLARTTASAPVTFRVGEAIQVLDDFPDQSHPKVRSARVFALGYIDAGAARSVRAYGPADGLAGHDARRRRRLWWRSAGPAGQLWVLMTSRIRRVRRAAEQSEPVPRTEAESEAIARVLDSVQGEPPATIRERIEEAWRQHGRFPSLLLAHADADADEGDYWHCLALAVEALRISPGSLDATCRLAGAVYPLVGYGTALRVIASLSKSARRTTEARVTLGDIHGQAQNFALAAAAYGDPRDLGRYDRRLRRRCVRRGLLRRLSSSTRDRAEAVDLGWFDVVSPDVAKVLDKCSSLRDQPAKVREAVNNALDQHGRHPLLLLELADIEHDDPHASAALAAEAIRSAPANPLVVDGGIRELWLSEHDPDALFTINDLADQVRSSADVGASVSRVFTCWRLWGHAFEAFGERGLVARLWRERRHYWWRSGGPFARIRRSVMAQEDALISAANLPERQSITLSALPLAAPVAAAVRAELALYRMNLNYRMVYRPAVFDSWTGRIGRLLLPVITFAALVLAEHLRRLPIGNARTLVTAAVATAAELVTFWLLARLTRRRVSRLIVAAGCAGGAVYLVQVPRQWPFGAGAALAAFAVTIAGVYLATLGTLYVRRIPAARLQQQHAEISALSGLLDLLGELTAPKARRDAEARRDWMTAIERIAVTVERDLPHALRSGDPESQSTVVAHARSAAAGLRGMKQIVALPDEASWRGLITQLTELTTALACGDFANWPPPQVAVTIPRTPRPLWWRALQAGRALLLIVGPPLVAFLLPLVVPLSGEGVAWLRLATLVWALLASIIALDPAIADRVAKMRQVLDLLRDVAPPKGAASQSASNTPVGDAQWSLSGSMPHSADSDSRLKPVPRSQRLPSSTRRYRR